jgi:hypothetical protein
MESWIVSADRCSATVSGRVPISILKKINPLWWFQNETEQTVDHAPDYHPEWPYWRRWLVWNVVRNPLQNFRCFVIGVQDRNYTVTGKAPVGTVQRDDIGEIGWQWSVIWLAFPLPFVSYSGRRVIWYVGWQPSGFAGCKLNFHR